MELIECVEEAEVLKIIVNSNEESLFFLLKGYLNEASEVDLVGVSKDHHLIDRSEFYLKVKKGSSKTFFKKMLKDIKKKLEKLKIK